MKRLFCLKTKNGLTMKSLFYLNVKNGLGRIAPSAFPHYEEAFLPYRQKNGLIIISLLDVWP